MLFRRQHRQKLQQFQSDLLSYARALTRNSELARDLSQDCVIRVLKAGSIPRDDRAYKSWLFSILRNLWLDHLRRARRLDEVVLDDLAEPVAVPIEAEAALINAITVRMAFECLSDNHRDVLSLVDVAGFTYKETADILGVSIGTVMSRVSRARARMLNLMEQGNVVELRPRKMSTRK